MQQGDSTRRRSRTLASLLAGAAIALGASAASSQDPVAGYRFNQQRPDVDEHTYSVDFPHDPFNIRLLLDQPQDGDYFSGQIAGLGLDWNTRLGTFTGAYRETDLDLDGDAKPISLFGLGFDNGTWRANIAATSESGTYATVARNLGAWNLRGEYRKDITPEDAATTDRLVRPLPRTTFAGTGIQSRTDIPILQEGTLTSGAGLGASWTRGAHAFDLDVFSGTEHYLGSPIESDLMALRAAYRVAGQRLDSLVELETHKIGDSLYNMRFGTEQSFETVFAPKEQAADEPQDADKPQKPRLPKGLSFGFTGFYNGLGTDLTDAASAYRSLGVGVRFQPRFGDLAIGPFATYEKDTILPSETAQYGLTASWRGWSLTGGQSTTTQGRTRFATERSGYVAGFQIPINKLLAMRVMVVDEGMGEDQYGDAHRFSQANVGIVLRNDR